MSAIADGGPSFRTLDAPTCEIGEAPSYDPHTDIAWWVDIPARKLLEHRFATGRTLIHELPFMASAVARIDVDHQLLAAESGLYVREIVTGRLTLHKEIEARDPATRSNDARTHPSGALWMGTIGKEEEDGAGSIYWYRSGEVRMLFDGISITNSICFAPSGDRGYFSDTRKGQLFTVALDPDTGLPTADPVTFGPVGLPGKPDGAVTDSEGRLLVARWDGSCVSVLDPRGNHVRDIALPAAQVTCPAFVGRSASELLVTTAATGNNGEQGGGEPGSGATFVGSIGMTGRFDHVVQICG